MFPMQTRYPKHRRINLKSSFAWFFSTIVFSLPAVIIAQDASTNTVTIPIERATTDSEEFGSPELELLRNMLPKSKPLMSEQEKALWQAQFFSTLSVMLPLMKACSSDMPNGCDRDDNPIACLANNVDTLSQCCAAQVRSTTGNLAIAQTTFHNGLVLPVNSSLEFDSSCARSKAVLSRPSPYHDIQIKSGPIFFDEAGDIELAVLASDLAWKGLSLAEQQPPTRIYRNGVPEFVRLSGPGSYEGIELEPMQLPVYNSIENTEWKTATSDDVFFLFDYSQVSRDPGTTKIHPNGQLARGRLATAVNVKGMLLAPGITSFTEQGQLLSGVLAKDYQHGKFTLATGPVAFNDEGQILTSTLAQSYQNDAWTIAADAVTFHGNGQLKTAFLQAGSTLNSSTLPAKAAITINTQGQLTTLSFPSNIADKTFEFGGLTLNANRSYQVHDSGQPKEISILTHKMYRGKLYPKRTRFEFDHNGEVIWDSFYDKELQDEYKRQRGMLPEILPMAQVRQGVFLPKGSIVYSGFYGRAERAIIPHATAFNDVVLAAGEIEFSKQTSHLALGTLNGDQTINGIRFHGSPKSIMFDQQGRVIFGQLSGNQSINKISFADETGINLSAGGIPSQGTLADTTDINGIPLMSGTKVKFDKSGRLQAGYLATDHPVDGITYKAGTQIYFDNKGLVRSGILAGDHNIVGTTLPAETSIRLFEGRLHSLALKQAIEIQGYSLDGRIIEFHKDGALRTGVLAKDSVIDGKSITAGSQLLLDSSGHLLGTEFVGLIRPPAINTSNGVIMAGPEPLRLRSPPTISFCRKVLSDNTVAVGYSLGNGNGETKRRCSVFYREFRE